MEQTVRADMTNDMTIWGIPGMEASMREVFPITGHDAGRTIIGKLAALPQAQMTHTSEIDMLQCLETLEVKR